MNQLTFRHVISVRVYAPFIRFVIHSHRYLKTYLTFYDASDSHQIRHTLLTFLAMDIRLCSAYFYWVLIFNSARLVRIKSYSLLTKAITIERRSWKLRCYHCLANNMFVEAEGFGPWISPCRGDMLANYITAPIFLLHFYYTTNILKIQTQSNKKIRHKSRFYRYCALFWNICCV